MEKNKESIILCKVSYLLAISILLIAVCCVVSCYAYKMYWNIQQTHDMQQQMYYDWQNKHYKLHHLRNKPFLKKKSVDYIDQLNNLLQNEKSIYTSKNQA